MVANPIQFKASDLFYFVYQYSRAYRSFDNLFPRIRSYNSKLKFKESSKLYKNTFTNQNIITNYLLLVPM